MFKTPISVLQEFAVQHGLPLPQYEMTSSGQSHCMSFECHVKIGNKNASGQASTKKDAKQAAASNLLQHFGIKREGEKEVSNICLLPIQTKKDGPVINFVGKINEFASQHKYSQPNYSERTTINDNKFCITCEFHEFKTEGKGSTKKDAKQNAAKEMWMLIKEKDIGYNSFAEPSHSEVNNADFELILKKYTTIINNMSIKSEPLASNINAVWTEDSKITNWDELIAYMNNRGWQHEVTVFQLRPLMLCLKINDRTLINYGETREEIRKKFVESVVRMLKQGHNFNELLILS